MKTNCKTVFINMHKEKYNKVLNELLTIKNKNLVSIKNSKDFFFHHNDIYDDLNIININKKNNIDKSEKKFYNYKENNKEIEIRRNFYFNYSDSDDEYDNFKYGFETNNNYDNYDSDEKLYGDFDDYEDYWDSIYN